MKRLLTYLKPHKWVMTTATLLVLFIIVVELYRPIIIGDAIDDYINGYYSPYTVTTEDGTGAVAYKDIYLTRETSATSDISGDADIYYQLVLYNDNYYMAENLSAEECESLKDATSDVISQYIKNDAHALSHDELRELRHYDFIGILYAAGLYLLMLLLGFVLNAVDTWMLQKMGQKIIYRMREEVFSHIHI